MAQPQESGDKTEKATPKKLRDARKRGEVAKSRDLTSTVCLAFSITLIILSLSYISRRLIELIELSLHFNTLPFDSMLIRISAQSIEVLLTLSALVLLPIVVMGLLLDFLQVGPVFALEKLKPSVEKLDFVAGTKRMFGMDNFVELLKNVAKAIVLGTIAYYVVSAFLDELVLIPSSQAMAIVAGMRTLTVYVIGWTLAVFLVLMFLDLSYQRHSFAKRMRMSIRDIKQEHKQTQGDPLIRNQRRQMHREYANQGRQQAASEATVLVVNPTHVAVAIRYDRDDVPVPIVTAKAIDDAAANMREAADESHVPVLRNEHLARTLLADVEEGDVIPRGLFDVVAEVVLWANRTHDYVSLQRGERAILIDEPQLPDPPGIDLTHYPDQSYSHEP